MFQAFDKFRKPILILIAGSI
ncbi:MAG: hypothetical protein RLZZ195_541, partial [Pseudomonadota bacterium]